MKRELRPRKKIGGSISVPGDKSIAHRGALFSILSENEMVLKNFPDNQDCNRSLEAARLLGVNVDKSNDEIRLTPPALLSGDEDLTIDCGNSGTTARLLAGIIAGSDIEVTLTGDESLSSRPMKRIIDPLREMGAELFANENKLPLKISGKKLLPFDYRLPIASAQVKSAVLLAGLAASCSVSVTEDVICRDHTEQMINALGTGIEIEEIKPVLTEDERDPRKKRLVMPEDFKKVTRINSQAKINGGLVDIPGDISTAAFFMAAAAISKKTITVTNLGLNPTRTGFLNHLKNIGCTVEIKNKKNVSGELRGDVTVCGGMLKPRKIYGETTVNLIDEIPIVSVIAAFTEGTTIIRDAAELKVKESDRLEAIAYNLKLMGVKCGVLEDGLAIEGGKDLGGSDFKGFGDHRIVMAFSIASLFLDGPSTIDDDSAAAISCPGFYDLLGKISE